VHLTSSPIDWYAARAAGIVAYLLLTAVVAVGVGLAGRMNGKRWPRFAVEDVHRFGGLLVGTFIAIHVATIAIDSYLPFTLTQLVIPFTDSYRPLWTALGIVAAELLLALAVTNRLRGRIPHRWWRTSHYLNFVVWAGATAHGVGTGSDRSAVWMMAIYAISVALVLSLVVRRAGRPRLVPVAIACGLVPLLVAAGPLHRSTKAWNTASFDESLTGRILQQGGNSAQIVSMTGSGRGTQEVLVRADLLLSGSGERTAFRMEYLPSGLICSGTVTKARSFGFDGVCRMPDGSHRSVTADWHLTTGANLAGRLRSRSA
jgi:DMSO/TMAO reductase YedYZ heme-binding membrane subunit